MSETTDMNLNMGAVGRVHFCSARKKNPAQLESFRYLDPGATLLVRARPKTPISVSGVCNADLLGICGGGQTNAQFHYVTKHVLICHTASWVWVSK